MFYFTDCSCGESWYKKLCKLIFVPERFSYLLRKISRRFQASSYIILSLLIQTCVKVSLIHLHYCANG